MTTPVTPISTEGGQAEYDPVNTAGKFQLPFTFAKHHGVLLDAETDPPRSGADRVAALSRY